jgi:hypothetical protein
MSGNQCVMCACLVQAGKIGGVNRFPARRALHDWEPAYCTQSWCLVPSSAPGRSGGIEWKKMCQKAQDVENAAE